MYHNVPWFSVYQAREMQIKCLTSLSICITMQKQCVCGFVSTDIYDCSCMTKLHSFLKEADFSNYWITMSKFHTEF